MARLSPTRLFVVAAALLSIAGTARAQTWTFDWADEFDGSSLNPSKWTAVANCGDRRNNEQQCYDTDAVSVANGYLTITARRQSRNGFAFVSGAVKTGTTYEAGPPVRVEFRAKLPEGGQGIWPALWMYPRSQWPPEIDVLEAVNDMRAVYMTYHWGTSSNHSQQGGSTWVDGSSTAFHVYAIEWEPTAIRWYVDGQQRFSVNGPQVTSTPMQLYINLALGGSWPGPVGGSTPFPQTLVVDWVRVYRSGTGGGAASGGSGSGGSGPVSSACPGGSVPGMTCVNGEYVPIGASSGSTGGGSTSGSASCPGGSIPGMTCVNGEYVPIGTSSGSTGSGSAGGSASCPGGSIPGMTCVNGEYVPVGASSGSTGSGSPGSGSSGSGSPGSSASCPGGAIPGMTCVNGEYVYTGDGTAASTSSSLPVCTGGNLPAPASNWVRIGLEDWVPADNPLAVRATCRAP